MRYLGILFGTLIGSAVLRNAYAIAPRPPLTSLEWVLFVLLMLLAIHLVIAVHEVGHIVGGWIAGLQFRFLVVGPLRIERAGSRLRFGINRTLRDYGGMVGSAPKDGQTFRRGWIVKLAAGPVSSLAAGALAALLLRRVGVAMVAGSGFTGFSGYRALALFAAGSLAVGIITAMPGGTRQRPTDASRIITLVRGG